MEMISVLPNGYYLYMEKNSTGGHTYYTDEYGFVNKVWDTNEVDLHTALQAIEYEIRRRKLDGEYFL